MLKEYIQEILNVLFVTAQQRMKNTHLHTCETFTCEYCFPKTLADLIPHLKTKHPKHLENTSII